MKRAHIVAIHPESAFYHTRTHYVGREVEVLSQSRATPCDALPPEFVCATLRLLHGGLDAGSTIFIFGVQLKEIDHETHH